MRKEVFWPLVNFENLKNGGGDVLGVWDWDKKRNEGV